MNAKKGWRPTLRVRRQRLGHATAQETLDTYSHLFPGTEDRTRDAIDHAFDAANDESGGTPKDAAAEEWPSPNNASRSAYQCESKSA